MDGRSPAAAPDPGGARDGRPPGPAAVLRRLGARRELVAGVLLGLAASATIVAGPWIVGLAIDDIRAGDRSGLEEYAAALVGVSVLFGVLWAGSMVLVRRAGLRAEADLRDRLYRAVERQDVGFARRIGLGQLLSRATVDVQPAATFLGQGLGTILQQIAFVLFAGIAMLVVDSDLALLALAPMPLTALAGYRYWRVATPAFRVQQQRVAEVTAEADESIEGHALVRAAGLEPLRRDRFRAVLDRQVDQALYVTRVQARYDALLSTLPYLGLIAVLVVGGREVIGGEIPLGKFTAFYSYVLMLAGPMAYVGNFLAMGQQAAASTQRLHEITDRPPSPTEAAGEIPPADRDGRGGAVALDRVETEAGAWGGLTGLDLRLAPGESVAIVGLTGAGKTALLELVNRFRLAEGGQVEVDGVDLAAADPEAVRSASALAEENASLFSLTVAENIAYGRPDATREEIEDAARAAQAHDFIAGLPDGYDTRLGEEGTRLSRGQRQRLAAARALLARRRILLVDNVSGSMDPAAGRDVLVALLTRSGATCLVAASHPAALARADRVAVLDGGRVVAVGPHDELERDLPAYREIVAAMRFAPGEEPWP